MTHQVLQKHNMSWEPGPLFTVPMIIGKRLSDRQGRAHPILQAFNEPAKRDINRRIKSRTLDATLECEMEVQLSKLCLSGRKFYPTFNHAERDSNFPSLRKGSSSGKGVYQPLARWSQTITQYRYLKQHLSALATNTWKSDCPKSSKPRSKLHALL